MGLDPVENASFIPWLTPPPSCTRCGAGRRGMLRVWNLSLIIATFCLTILGRSSPLRRVELRARSRSRRSAPGCSPFWGWPPPRHRGSSPGGATGCGHGADRLARFGKVAFLANNLSSPASAFVVAARHRFPSSSRRCAARRSPSASTYFDADHPIGLAPRSSWPWRGAAVRPPPGGVLRRRLAAPAWAGPHDGAAPLRRAGVPSCALRVAPSPRPASSAVRPGRHRHRARAAAAGVGCSRRFRRTWPATDGLTAASSSRRRGLDSPSLGGEHGLHDEREFHLAQASGAPSRATTSPTSARPSTRPARRRRSSPGAGRAGRPHARRLRPGLSISPTPVGIGPRGPDRPVRDVYLTLVSSPDQPGKSRSAPVESSGAVAVGRPAAPHLFGRGSPSGARSALPPPPVGRPAPLERPSPGAFGR